MMSNGSITANECYISRSVGSVFLIVSTIFFPINLYALSNVWKSSMISIRDRILVLLLFVSSLSIMAINVPSFVVQSWLCRPWNVTWICQIDGFNFVFNVCLVMYILVVLSIVRFTTTANSSCTMAFHRRFESHTYLLALICVTLSSLWAILPFFGRVHAYVAEGLGFHCALNWFDRSRFSETFLCLFFMFVYLFPSMIILYINRYLQSTVYRLTHLDSTLGLEMDRFIRNARLRRHISNQLHIQESRRFQCLQEDRRFIAAVSSSLLIYFISWIPYGVLVMAQVSGLNVSIIQPSVITGCALLVKLSLMINPSIFTLLLKGREIIIVTHTND